MSFQGLHYCCHHYKTESKLSIPEIKTKIHQDYGDLFQSYEIDCSDKTWIIAKTEDEPILLNQSSSSLRKVTETTGQNVDDENEEENIDEEMMNNDIDSKDIETVEDELCKIIPESEKAVNYVNQLHLRFNIFSKKLSSIYDHQFSLKPFL